MVVETEVKVLLVVKVEEEVEEEEEEVVVVEVEEYGGDGMGGRGGAPRATHCGSGSAGRAIGTRPPAVTARGTGRTTCAPKKAKTRDVERRP